jgi:hypothetical protein
LDLRNRDSTLFTGNIKLIFIHMVRA